MTRRAALVKVQIARKELGLQEDDYRSILERLTGRTSSADCSDAELGRVLDEFRAKGWVPKVVVGGKAKVGMAPTSAGTAPRSIPNRPADHPAAKKARALWLSLWNLGEVRDSSEAALEAFARRQLKVERLQWADQALTYKLIEALKAMAGRAGWDQSPSVPPSEHVFTLKARLWIAQESRLGDPDWTTPTELAHWLKCVMTTVTEAELDVLISANGQSIREHGLGSIG